MGKGKKQKRGKKHEKQDQDEIRQQLQGDRAPVGVGAVGQPLQIASNPEPNAQGDPSTAKRGEYLRNLFRSGRRWALRGNRPFSIAIVLFAAASFLAAMLQWDATNKQWRVMVLDQRPWIKIEIPTFDKPVPGKPLQSQLELKNTGKTPAFVKDATFSIIMFGSDEDFDTMEKGFLKHHAAAKTPEYFPVAPDSVYMAGLHNGPMIKEDIEAKLYAGKLIILIAARIVYADTAGDLHTSERWFISNQQQSAMVGYGKYDRMD